MPSYLQVMLLRGKGKSFSEIGLNLGVSKQRARVIFTGYKFYERQTETYKKYKLHLNSHLNKVANCRYCLKEYGN